MNTRAYFPWYLSRANILFFWNSPEKSSILWSWCRPESSYSIENDGESFIYIFTLCYNFFSSVQLLHLFIFSYWSVNQICLGRDKKWQNLCTPYHQCDIAKCLLYYCFECHTHTFMQSVFYTIVLNVTHIYAKLFWMSQTHTQMQSFFYSIVLNVSWKCVPVRVVWMPK